MQLNPEQALEGRIIQARHWMVTLKRYRQPSNLRSLYEAAVTLGAFVLSWSFALFFVINGNHVVALCFAIFIGFILMRLFCLMHDCGHNALFTKRWMNRWAGRLFGYLCVTPMALWVKKHEIHHASHGNLDARGMGDIQVYTVDEYLSLSPFQKTIYRIYRNPFFLLSLGPFVAFLIEYRVPSGLMDHRKYWASAISTNMAVGVSLASLVAFTGWNALFWIFLPSIFVGGFAGVWVFYIQHQFEGVHWSSGDDWDVNEAALFGSSYLALPSWLNWFTCNIGIHHVHHAYSRIPFYRLPEVLRDHPDLAQYNRLTLKQSWQCMKLKLWDCSEGRLVGFPEK